MITGHTIPRDDAKIAGALRTARKRLAEFHQHTANGDDIRAATALEHFVWYQAFALECGASINEITSAAGGTE